MMSSVIAAFFHCVSGKNNSLHGQCPEGSKSWCRYQRAKAAGSPLKEIEQGLPNKIINQIKPTYLKLCNETLLKKCLHEESRESPELPNLVTSIAKMAAKVAKLTAKNDANLAVLS
ncbi:uncharacterized protein LOC101238613 [Trichonephila clavipes]|nr:uncharacterized protein LOC101238613 [Trichonephila clavipes]